VVAFVIAAAASLLPWGFGWQVAVGGAIFAAWPVAWFLWRAEAPAGEAAHLHSPLPA
jgi:hypothetical protein